MWGRALVNVVYVVLIVVCVLFSTVTAYRGYESFVDQTYLAVLLTALVALTLLGADTLIRINRERGTGEVGFFPILLLAIGIILSTPAHFNYFFTTFQGDQIAKDGFRSQNIVFQENMAAAIGAYQRSEAYVSHQALDRAVTSDLEHLRRELADVIKQGYGPDALGLESAVRALLGANMIRTLNAPPLGTRDKRIIDPWFDSFKGAAEAAVVRAKPEGYDAIAARIAEIQRKRAAYAAYEQSLSDIANTVRREDISTEAQKMADDSNLEKTELITRNMTEAAAQFRPIDPLATQSGRIALTLRQAGMPQNFLVTFASLILSLFIDLVPLIFAIAAFRPNDNDTFDMGRGGGGPRAYSG